MRPSIIQVFSVTWRGYNRQQVDKYVGDVNNYVQKVETIIKERPTPSVPSVAEPPPPFDQEASGPLLESLKALSGRASELLVQFEADLKKEVADEKDAALRDARIALAQATSQAEAIRASAERERAQVVKDLDAARAQIDEYRAESQTMIDNKARASEEQFRERLAQLQGDIHILDTKKQAMLADLKKILAQEESPQ